MAPLGLVTSIAAPRSTCPFRFRALSRASPSRKIGPIQWPVSRPTTRSTTNISSTSGGYGRPEQQRDRSGPWVGRLQLDAFDLDDARLSRPLHLLPGRERTHSTTIVISLGCMGLSPGQIQLLKFSPGLEGAGDTLHKGGSPGGSVEVHVVKREILETALRIDQCANVVAHETLRRILFCGDAEACLAVGANGGHALDVAQIGMELPRLVDADGDARQKTRAGNIPA